MSDLPSRGEIWFIDLSEPPKGHEQAGNRPALVISTDQLNHGPADLAIVIPITKAGKGIPTHVEINPPEGGLKMRSYAMCEAVRCISISKRFVKRMGSVSTQTIRLVEDRLRILLDL